MPAEERWSLAARGRDGHHCGEATRLSVLGASMPATERASRLERVDGARRHLSSATPVRGERRWADGPGLPISYEGERLRGSRGTSREHARAASPLRGCAASSLMVGLTSPARCGNTRRVDSEEAGATPSPATGCCSTMSVKIRPPGLVAGVVRHRRVGAPHGSTGRPSVVGIDRGRAITAAPGEVISRPQESGE